MSDLPEPKPQGNALQAERLTELNDTYGVDRWELEGLELHIWCDDGDEADIHPDGTVTWKEARA